MSMNDPVADMLTRVRNAQLVGHATVSIPSSKIKADILKVMQEEGYIEDFKVQNTDKHPEIIVQLKYYQGKPVIEKIERVSRPGLRVYKNFKHLPKVAGFGVAILSTSQGVMTHLKAKKLKVGGELVCELA